MVPFVAPGAAISLLSQVRDQSRLAALSCDHIKSASGIVRSICVAPGSQAVLPAITFLRLIPLNSRRYRVNGLPEMLLLIVSLAMRDCTPGFTPWMWFIASSARQDLSRSETMRPSKATPMTWPSLAVRNCGAACDDGETATLASPSANAHAAVTMLNEENFEDLSVLTIPPWNEPSFRPRIIAFLSRCDFAPYV